MEFVQRKEEKVIWKEQKEREAVQRKKRKLRKLNEKNMHKSVLQSKKSLIKVTKN